MKDDIFISMVHDWAKFTKVSKLLYQNVPLGCISNLCSKSHKTRDEVSTFSGSGGYLYLYIKMYKFLVNLEEEEKVLRIVKLEEGYAVLLRIVSDSEKNKKLLVRTLKGINKWINFTPQIRTIPQKSELNIENLRLSDHMIDEEIILK